MTLTDHRYSTCAAPACAKTPRPFSRYCRYHYSKIESTRSLTGKVIRKEALTIWRQIAAEWLEEHAQHTAVIAAEEFLGRFLRDDGRAGFLRSEFNRLADNGATPRALLTSVLAMHLWQERAREHMDDRCFRLNLGRAVLGTVPAKRRTSRNGKTYTVRPRPGHAEALGKHIQENLGGFALVAARAALNDVDPEPASTAILRALQDEPL